MEEEEEEEKQEKEEEMTIMMMMMVIMMMTMVIKGKGAREIIKFLYCVPGCESVCILVGVYERLYW